jgi:ribosomal 50S subunit-recycling heat shock protein
MSLRVDVWLWRARLFKTRTLAAKIVDEGKVRLTRAGVETRLDKASRTLHLGDQIVFAHAARVTAVRVEALGERRGPPAEARTLYSDLENY